jgi:protein-L-isoaspartate(D-aspartate) O-methyltransferase
MTNFMNPAVAAERLVKILASKGITDDRVLDAFRSVPRHLFVDGAMYAQAYDDNALPIGSGQTISQPYVVALMTQLLQLGKDDKILEVGTGSGFQAAILAQFSRRVYTIERQNIAFKQGDGSAGWVQHAPFDRIIVTAGAPVVPEVLIEQLATDGRMIVPVGGRLNQELIVYEKTGQEIKNHTEGGVIFVPLIGQHGWREEQNG